jgi:hypothetical protein
MVLLRLLVILFNVAVVTYLIYRLFIVIQQPMVRWRKILVVTAGLLLLFSPFSMFIGAFRPGLTYFFAYPVAILVFLYLIREVN